MRQAGKLLVASAMFAGAMALSSGAAYAAAAYCSDGDPNPDGMSVTDVTLTGEGNADDCYGRVDGNTFDTTLWSGGWTGPAKDEGDTFVLGGVTFAVTAQVDQQDGDWELILSDPPPNSITFDLVVVLKASDGWGAYLFEDVTLSVPSNTDGTYIISFENNGGQIPDLSHLEAYARLGQEPPQLPEPGSLLLLALGLAGLALTQRRRRV